MTGYKSAALVGVCTVLGAAGGIAVANWNFVDPDVLRGARVLFSIFGAVAAGFASKWFFTGAHQNN